MSLVDGFGEERLEVCERVLEVVGEQDAMELKAYRYGMIENPVDDVEYWVTAHH
jgi:hypothetical protein